jgi:hypothetical protein
MAGTIQCIRYFGGWADKIHGNTIETNETRLAYTRHEPYGVVVRLTLVFFLVPKNDVRRRVKSFLVRRRRSFTIITKLTLNPKPGNFPSMYKLFFDSSFD